MRTAARYLSNALHAFLFYRLRIQLHQAQMLAQEVPLTEEQLARIAEIDAFLIEHSVKVNRKKKKLLAGLPVGPYETYKLGVIVANCCKVLS